MKYAYFPGCSASSTGIAYTLSYNYVARRTGIDMQEIPDWNCCGATVAHLESQELGDALPARSLAISEATFGNTPVLAPCAGCYLHLKTATDHARKSEQAKQKIEDIIQRPWNASAEVVNGLQPFMDDAVREQVENHICSPLTGLKVACYYGCALLRPTEVVEFDDDEQPHTMEDLLALCGIRPVEWSFKNECCGASHQISMPTVGRSMVRRIMENAAASGADAIACACPLCMLNLDMRESEVNAARIKEGKDPIDIPVYYFTELIAASFGATPEKSGINRHFHPAENLQQRARVAFEEEQKRLAEEAAKNPRKRRAAGKNRGKAAAKPARPVGGPGSAKPKQQAATPSTEKKEVVTNE